MGIVCFMALYLQRSDPVRSLQRLLVGTRSFRHNRLKNLVLFRLSENKTLLERAGVSHLIFVT